MKYFFVGVLICSSLLAHAQSADTTKANQDSSKNAGYVDVEAQFPGGMKGWQRYPEASLNADLGAQYLRPKKGKMIQQTALVSFLVDTPGNVSEVEVMNPKEVHPKLAAESARVIREGPKWNPATVNGQKVVFRQKQNITWQVSFE